MVVDAKRNKEGQRVEDEREWPSKADWATDDGGADEERTTGQGWIIEDGKGSMVG